MVSLLASTNIKVILITCLLSFLCHSANTHTHHSNNTITIDIANRNDVTTNLHRYLRRSWFQFFNSFRSVCTSAAAFNVCRGSDELFSLAILRFCHSVWHYTITYWFLIGIRASSHCVDSALQSTRQPIDDRALFFFHSFIKSRHKWIHIEWNVATPPQRRYKIILYYLCRLDLHIVTAVAPIALEPRRTDTQTIQRGKMNGGKKRAEKDCESHEIGEVKLWNDVKRNEWIFFFLVMHHSFLVRVPRKWARTLSHAAGRRMVWHEHGPESRATKLFVLKSFGMCRDPVYSSGADV